MTKTLCEGAARPDSVIDAIMAEHGKTEQQDQAAIQTLRDQLAGRACLPVLPSFLLQNEENRRLPPPIPHSCSMSSRNLRI